MDDLNFPGWRSEKSIQVAEGNGRTRVLGRQGTLSGEYWHGDISEVLVFKTLLSSNVVQLSCLAPPNTNTLIMVTDPVDAPRKFYRIATPVHWGL